MNKQTRKFILRGGVYTHMPAKRKRKAAPKKRKAAKRKAAPKKRKAAKRRKTSKKR